MTKSPHFSGAIFYSVASLNTIRKKYILFNLCLVLHGLIGLDIYSDFYGIACSDSL